jgi:MoxR-like ATPase
VTHALQINEIEAARERLADVRREVMNVYIGDPSAVDMMLIALLSRGHVLLEGVPGVAKTTLVKAFAATLGSSIRRVQFTPDLSSHPICFPPTSPAPTCSTRATGPSRCEPARSSRMSF